MKEDLFPEETCEMLVALSKKQNRIILKKLLESSIPDKDVTPKMLKSLKEMGMLMMTNHTGKIIGFSENHYPVFEDEKYNISELGQTIIQKIHEVWQLPKIVSPKVSQEKTT